MSDEVITPRTRPDLNGSRLIICLLSLLTILFWGAGHSQAQTTIESGQTLCGSIAFPGAVASYTFYGTAGAGVVVVATTSSGSLDPEVFLYSPSSTLEASDWGNTQARIDNHTLAESGWYTIVIKNFGGSFTGAFCVSLVLLPGSTSLGEIQSGLSLSGTVSHNIESTTFYGTAGSGVVIVATTASGSLDPQVFLYAPSGAREISGWGNSQVRIDPHTLAETGLYTIVVEDHTGSSSGAFCVSLVLLPGSTSLGEIQSGLSLSGTLSYNIESTTFYGTAGSGVVVVATTASGSLDPQAFLYAPSGAREASDWGNTQARIDGHTLAETGWYTIVVEDYYGPWNGIFDVSLVLIPAIAPPAASPTPSNGATVDPWNVVLSWANPSGATSFDVYLGRTWPLSLVASDAAGPPVVVPPLVDLTYYHWYVVAKYPSSPDLCGCEWWFYTEAPPLFTDGFESGDTSAWSKTIR
jgi:hypothetical protein